ncbi:hypothetical protein F4778DRAFT_718877 [Xylariomycetidae sp. FL2044]|nr:hypothetical protein F4778DRAFT_718877 [Xylariomycetidae sp. FL2044]
MNRDLGIYVTVDVDMKKGITPRHLKYRDVIVDNWRSQDDWKGWDDGYAPPESWGDLRSINVLAYNLIENKDAIKCIDVALAKKTGRKAKPGTERFFPGTKGWTELWQCGDTTNPFMMGPYKMLKEYRSEFGGKAISCVDVNAVDTARDGELSYLMAVHISQPLQLPS